MPNPVPTNTSQAKFPIRGLGFTQGMTPVKIENLPDPVVIKIPNTRDRTNDTVRVNHEMRARNDWPCQKFEVINRFMVIVVNVSGKKVFLRIIR